MKPLILAVLLSLLTACASTDDAETRAENVREAKAWYCGPGMMGIRAVARFTIYLFTGASVPNACKVIDAVIEADQ